MTDPDLIRRAQAAGLEPFYTDSRGHRVEVGEETIGLILSALDSAPGAVPQAQALAEPPARYGRPGTAGGTARPLGTPRSPVGRSWGFALQLYSLRSVGSWGHGDLRDLADLAVWSAGDLGADFVLVNPLHAAEPLPPVSPSPYLPMTRRYISPLYLRIEDIPEYQVLGRGQRERIRALAVPLQVRNATADLIDRDAVWAAKRQALEIIYQVPLTDERLQSYRAFRQREGRDLAGWTAWCALAEQLGPDWRSWPGPARDPRSAASVAAAGKAPEPGTRTGPVSGSGAAAGTGPGAGGAGFHAWLQWLADEQIAAAQRSALAAGMGTGIITDLAVGSHPGGADAWANQDLLVSGLSVGAPPDEFNQRGQDWMQPPWHPQRLASAGYLPLSDLFGGALRHSGGLRVDHVMGLMRLWCMPQGMPPDRGAYLRYDHGAAVAALAGQAAQAGALAIGEDLGTVPAWIRRYLADSGILGTSMLWFERDPGGAPLPPGRWRRACMATVGTHDVPPAAAFLTGDQVTIRARLGLLKLSEDAERDAARRMLSGWLDALAREGLIAAGPAPGPDDFTVALYGYLAKTPAALIGVSLADAVGDRRPQNIPGTRDQYPNWQIPLCGADGRAVLLEDLPGFPLLQAVARAAAGAVSIRRL
jgi:4-alpha-glucanotransferase